MRESSLVLMLSPLVSREKLCQSLLMVITMFRTGTPDNTNYLLNIHIRRAPEPWMVKWDADIHHQTLDLPWVNHRLGLTCFYSVKAICIIFYKSHSDVIVMNLRGRKIQTLPGHFASLFIHLTIYLTTALKFHLTSNVDAFLGSKQRKGRVSLV